MLRHVLADLSGAACLAEGNGLHKACSLDLIEEGYRKTQEVPYCQSADALKSYQPYETYFLQV